MSEHRAPAPDVSHLADARTVRRLLGNISSERLRQIMRDHDDFPEHAVIAGGYVWDRASIKAWQLARTRPRRRAVYVLLTTYGRTGKLGVSARAAGMHTTTARRWLRRMGKPLPSDRQPDTADA